jgi:hypothetical protein
VRRKLLTVTTYNYPTRKILGDYARVGAGMTLTAIPLFLPNLNTVLEFLFGAAFLLFGYYGILTVKRHSTRVHVTKQCVSLSGVISTSISWREIKALKLDYFSMLDGAGNGWMQLCFSGCSREIKLDSRIDGFLKIAQLAASSARKNNLALDPITTDNLMALGIPSNLVGKGIPA